MNESSKVGRQVSLRIFIISAFIILVLLIILNLAFFNRSKSTQKDQPLTGALTNSSTGILPQNSVVVNKNTNTAADWESYMNANLKLSFQYPAGYQADILSENPVKLVIVSSPDLLKPGTELTPNDLKINIFSRPADLNDTLEKYNEDWKFPKESDDKIILEESFIINGVNFIHKIIKDPREEGVGDDIYLAIISNKRIFISKEPFNTKSQKEFNEILSTMIFNN